MVFEDIADIVHTVITVSGRPPTIVYSALDLSVRITHS
jgi:hypothetical protein